MRSVPSMSFCLLLPVVDNRLRIVCYYCCNLMKRYTRNPSISLKTVIEYLYVNWRSYVTLFLQVRCLGVVGLVDRVKLFYLLLQNILGKEDLHSSNHSTTLSFATKRKTKNKAKV